MNSEQLSQVSSVCIASTGEYRRVLNYIGLEGQLKEFSLTQVKLNGIEFVGSWFDKVGDILGFQKGIVRLEFKPSLRTGGHANALKNVITLGYESTLSTIVHEYTHILSYFDTTTFGSKSYEYYGVGRKNKSVHNKAFAEWLVASMDNVLEHAEELGIRVWTAEDVLREVCQVSPISGRLQSSFV